VRRVTVPSLVLSIVVALASLATPRMTVASDPPTLLSKRDLGGIHRTVTTRSSRAQAYFDQGLMQTFGFDHEEAIRSFQRATELDPTCAMAWWGIAFAAGPNINIPFMDEPRSKLAYEAAQQAAAHAGHCTPAEQALITAIAKRYAWPAPEDRRPLDEAFASEMRHADHLFPEDSDIGAWFAESLMDLRPWDLWSPSGEPRPETAEIVQVLETVLARDPNHVMAIHLYIHSIEASPDPGRARAASDRLRGRIHGSGHLLHMPSHIDIRLGRYADAIAANELGIAADQARVRRAGRGGVYALYRAHNYHFLVFAAMFDGQRELAIRNARKLVEEVPLDVVREYRDLFDGFLATPYHAMVRFGMWPELIAEPSPPEDLPVTTALYHYARGIAYSSVGRVDEALAEQAAFEKTYAQVPEGALMGNNPARVVLDIARPMLAGEIEYRRRNFDRAFELLREGVARDDSLRYDEPWGWMQPVRHALGALLLEQGHTDEAEQVYRADLEQHPGNGWALHGLAECLRRNGQASEAAAVDERFRSAWTRSDIKLQASCFCARGM
jgi:tetratricopeptide (TPR) repeat protein